jgi:hypothetical protein
VWNEQRRGGRIRRRSVRRNRRSTIIQADIIQKLKNSGIIHIAFLAALKYSNAGKFLLLFSDVLRFR